MSTLLDCGCSSGCAPLPGNVPGSPGSPGNNGTDGVNAFTTLTSTIVIPATAGPVILPTTVTDGSWISIGQTLFASDGTQIGTFKVLTVSGNTLTLSFLNASGDSAGLTIAIGGLVSPGGVPGAAGATGAAGTVGNPTAFSPANPSTTTSATQVMMGLGATATITPAGSGKVLVLVTAMLANNTIGDGASAQLKYGTGAAPSNGDAATGTSAGKVKHMIASTAAGIQGVSLAFVVTGLTLATAYWFDVALNAVTGGTAAMTDVDIVLMEL